MAHAKSASTRTVWVRLHPGALKKLSKLAKQARQSRATYMAVVLEAKSLDADKAAGA